MEPESPTIPLVTGWGRSAIRPIRRIARSGVDRSIGLLPLYELKLESARWRETRQLTEQENAIVEDERRRLIRVPKADVAVVIATYRRPDRLVSAVSSVLDQSVEDLAVLVVSDGEPIQSNLPDDPRLTVVELQSNIGYAGVVRNIGIRLSNSRLIAFLDDDNTWLPNHLEVALAAHRLGAELSYSNLQRVDESGREHDVIGQPFDRRLMREQSLVDTNVIVVRRDPGVLFSRVPRRRGDFPLEDWELVWRLSKRIRVVHADDVTVRYVRHAGSNYSEWGATEAG